MNTLAAWSIVILATSLTAASAETISTFDVLVATGNLTVVGSATIQGSALSVGAATFTVAGGRIGIGTTTPSFQIHAVGPTVAGGGAQFRWIASSSSLRVGEVTGAA